MKRWQIIFWLLLFFPVGLYLMFKYSDWNKPLKYGITVFYTLMLLLGGVELWSGLFFISSFFIIIVGLFTVFRKRNRRNGLVFIVLGFFVLITSYPIVDKQIEEIELQEQLAIEAEAESKRLVEEKRLAEIARKEEQERIKKEEARIEEENKLKEKIVKAIEKVEEYSTQENYNEALELLEKLETKDSQLTSRLNKVLPEVELYEEKLTAAEKAIDQAQKNKNRTTYNEAYELVLALPVSNKNLTSRLETLDKEIIKIEEEQKAAEVAQKQAEEKQRIAVEKEAEKQAEAAASNKSSPKTSSERSSSGKNNSSGGNTTKVPAPAVSPPAKNDNVEKVVYVAPENGTKYHFSANCRGLNNANSIQELPLSQAKNQGYDLCGWEK